MKTESTIRPQTIERYPSMVRINWDVSQRLMEDSETAMYQYRMMELMGDDLYIDYAALIEKLITDRYPMRERLEVLSAGTATDIAEYRTYVYQCKEAARQFTGLPETDQMKAEYIETVIEGINAHTDERILTGFVWEGISVWLSAENQRNFSEAQRMAEKYGDAVLPLTFKLSEDEDGKAIYHTFRTAEELDAFYAAAFRYVNQCLQEGWEEKDKILKEE